jgi:hypothetical protein
MNDIAQHQRIAELRRQIAAETDCAKAAGLVAMADTIEEAMANAGYRGNTESLRPVNEVRFEARWKLGQLLAKVDRQQGGSTSRAGTLTPYLKEIGLNKNRANECERIAAIPAPMHRREQ